MKAALVRSVVRLLIAPVAAVLAVLVVLTAGASGAHAATDLSKVAQELRENPVYVDPAASGQLAASDAEALADKIKDAAKPVFVAVLPAGFPTQDLFRNLRTETGVTGLYGIRLGDQFDARADSAVMSRQAVSNLVTAVQDAGDTKAQLNDFVDDALRDVGGSAPSSWSDGSGTDVPVGGLITFGALVAAGGAGAYAVVRRNRRRHEEEQRVALEKLRVVVDEDITAFGEELDRLDFHPGEPGADDAMRADYERALDSYEQAKSLMAAATQTGGRPGRHAGRGGRPVLPGATRGPSRGRPAAGTPTALLLRPAPRPLGRRRELDARGRHHT